jgi:hypothetical protein
MPPKENHLVAMRADYPPKAEGCFIKSASPDFMKKIPLCPLRLCGENVFQETKMLQNE